jgi:hypothetical protein
MASRVARASPAGNGRPIASSPRSAPRSATSRRRRLRVHDADVDGLSIAPLHSPALASGPAGDRNTPRKFYATRHTFISLAMTKGMPLKLVTIYCGTSVEMIVQPLHVVAPWGSTGRRRPEAFQWASEEGTFGRKDWLACQKPSQGFQGSREAPCRALRQTRDSSVRDDPTRWAVGAADRNDSLEVHRAPLCQPLALP